VQRPVCCRGPNAEHTNVTRSPHTHTHTHTHISRCALATTVGRRAGVSECASVERRPNPARTPPASQPLFFSVLSNLSGTSLVRIVFWPSAAVRFTRKGVSSHFFPSYCATSYCFRPLLDSEYDARYVTEGLTSALKMDVAVLSQTVLKMYRTDTTQTRLALLFPEDGGSTPLRNVGNYQSIRCHVSNDLIVEILKLRLRF
jgi:hypothetical protein